MEIEATQFIKVILSEEQQKQVAINYLCGKYNWDRGYWIQDGWVMKVQKYSTSHSWTEDVRVRQATELDYFVAGVMKRL